MVNKLWYQDEYTDLGLGLVYNRNYIQKIINLYYSDIFQVPEDITTDTLQIFLESILKYYENYAFNSIHLADLASSIVKYFFKYYEDEFPETFFPEYPRTDRRELVLYVLNKADDSFRMWFPEDVPFVIECLNAPNEKIIDMYDRLYDYFEQFDSNLRSMESYRRSEILKVQRIKAIETNQPIPIKPMGIRLYPCYKRKDIDWLMVRTAGPGESIGIQNQFAANRGHYPQLLDGSIYDPDIHDVKTIYEKKL